MVLQYIDVKCCYGIEKLTMADYGGYMWNRTKSLYDTDAAYWYSQYEEQFLFEKGKLESQLAFFMLAGRLVLSIVAAVGLFILIAGYTIALPVVCYKLVKGSFLYLVQRFQNNRT